MDLQNFHMRWSDIRIFILVVEGRHVFLDLKDQSCLLSTDNALSHPPRHVIGKRQGTWVIRNSGQECENNQAKTTWA
jgi:hypothetical protein